MDGAIISGNCVSACDKNTTYHHLNNPVVKDLYTAHGKTLNFVGVIITNETVYLADKQRSSDWTAKLCRMLDLDGVLISQEGFGNPDTDLIMHTNIDGVFAAGDLRKKSLRQVVTAAADGAIAAMQVNKYLTEKDNKVYYG